MIQKPLSERDGEVPPHTHRVDFCNIRGIHSNINSVHYHREAAAKAEKLALFFLTETQISPPSDVAYLRYPGYNIEHAFAPRSWVCAFVREDICIRRLSNLESEDLSTLILRVDRDDHPRVYICLYRSHSGNDETSRLMEHIQMATDTILEQIPSAEVVVLGDFNAHHAEWLGSRTTDYAGRSVFDFAVEYSLTERSIKIVIDGACSDLKPVNAGVPQGTHAIPYSISSAY